VRVAIGSRGSGDATLEGVRLRRLAGAARAIHVWVGVLTAVGVIVVSMTGILLNHSTPLGWGGPGPPEVAGTGDLDAAAPINDSLRAALLAAVDAGVLVINDARVVVAPRGPGDIDRAVFRPATATVQVRLDDPRHTEVVVDWSTGATLLVQERRDARLDHLHSGEALGQRGVVLSDVVAVALVILTLGGGWIWLRRLMRRRPGGAGRASSTWLAANWWFHLGAGLAVVVYTIVLSVTGVILNHKREWGFMAEPARAVDAEIVARSEPGPLPEIVRWAVDERVRRGDDVTAVDVRLIDYRPLAGYAKVRFTTETEVIVDAYDGEVLAVSQRRDRWIEDLHSGVRFGANGWWISDVTAGLLILLMLNGLYLWLRPAVAGRDRPRRDPP